MKNQVLFCGGILKGVEFGESDQKIKKSKNVTCVATFTRFEGFGRDCEGGVCPF